ncbi:unnamed protein product [Notodromas monacha]|uniref:40S ribosomal protein S27a n=1 Tax=Notodromas monacha TaxID=399045 RepID=A0A7R9BLX5_9CRUS|nr:unnamed protein product [Notodromas monacha]CAG0916558.1 unnamed protein product [Notodromas monacha]
MMYLCMDSVSMIYWTPSVVRTFNIRSDTIRMSFYAMNVEDKSSFPPPNNRLHFRTFKFLITLLWENLYRVPEAIYASTVDGDNAEPRREDFAVNSLPALQRGAVTLSEGELALLLHQRRAQQFRPQPDLPNNSYGPAIGFPSLSSIYETDELSNGISDGDCLSPVRRFFCLFVTFDVLLSALMWLLTIVITGVNLRAGAEQQIVQYTIYTSLFDLVCVAAARFVFLVFTFALMRFKHWWPVALTTTLSCGFLVSKVFFYSWTQHNTYMFEVVFLLVSFILPWAETWFLDFRVLPLESKAGKFLYACSESRERLLPTFQTPGHGYRGPPGGTVAGSIYNFYSPIASSGGGSDHGLEDDDDLSALPGLLPTSKYKEYSSKNKRSFTDGEENLRKRGRDIAEECWNILFTAEWGLQQKIGEGTESHLLLYSAKYPNYKNKFYKVETTLDLSPRELLAEVFYNAEQAPTWNANLKSTKVLQIIDEFTDIIYQVTNDAAGGIVSSRDFVDLRHWVIRAGGIYVSSGASVEHSSMPPQPKIVRGINGPSCIALFPVEGREDQAHLKAMVQTDLNGWIPQRVIDKALSDVMIKSVQFIKGRIPALKERSRKRPSKFRHLFETGYLTMSVLDYFQRGSTIVRDAFCSRYSSIVGEHPNRGEGDRSGHGFLSQNESKLATFQKIVLWDNVPLSSIFLTCFTFTYWFLASMRPLGLLFEVLLLYNGRMIFNYCWGAISVSPTSEQREDQKEAEDWTLMENSVLSAPEIQVALQKLKTVGKRYFEAFKTLRKEQPRNYAVMMLGTLSTTAFVGSLVTGPVFLYALFLVLFTAPGMIHNSVQLNRLFWSLICGPDPSPEADKHVDEFMWKESQEDLRLLERAANQSPDESVVLEEYMPSLLRRAGTKPAVSKDSSESDSTIDDMMENIHKDDLPPGDHDDDASSFEEFDPGEFPSMDATVSRVVAIGESTLHLVLRLRGGGKKRKKKNYTTPKKNKHKHKKVKLAVLKYYKVDENGKIHRLRRECPGPDCGAGVFMAGMFDRQYCGKCGLTYSTLHLVLRLRGGGKKRKKKNYTTPKKNKHKHKKVKLAVLKYYKVDENGKIHRLRRECPGEECGAGVFMAGMFDRQYCGKCGLTYVFANPAES